MTAYPSAVLADSPIAYWRTNEMTGTVAGDSGSHGINGTYTGTFTLGGASPLVADPSGASLNTSGTGYVVVPANSVLDTPTTAVTMEMWIRPTSSTLTSFGGLLWHGGSSGNVGYSISLNSGGSSWFFNLGNGTTNYQLAPSGFGGFVNGSWLYMVATWDGTTMRNYNNAVAQGTSTAASGQTISYSGGPFDLEICNITGNTLVPNCLVDEVAVYNTTLSPTRITAHYNAATVAANALPRTTETSRPALMRAASW